MRLFISEVKFWFITNHFVIKVQNALPYFLSRNVCFLFTPVCCADIDCIDSESKYACNNKHIMLVTKNRGIKLMYNEEKLYFDFWNESDLVLP